jgi:hypothetical protein
VSIFFRTDSVVLDGPTLLVCCLERRIELWKAIVLALLALSTVLAINHFPVTTASRCFTTEVFSAFQSRPQK